MTDTGAEGTEDRTTDKTERLRSVYLSVTDGNTEPVTESQEDESTMREIHEVRADEAVGPAELHGLGDAIDDPEPAD